MKCELIHFVTWNNKQVVNLQTQLSALKEQAAQNFANGSGTSFTSANPNDHMSSSSSYGTIPCNYSTQDAQRWSHSETASMMPQFDDLNISVKNDCCDENAYNINSESSTNYHLQEANISFPSFEGVSSYSMDPIYADHMQTNNQQWSFREDVDDLQSVAFGYVQY